MNLSISLNWRKLDFSLRLMFTKIAHLLLKSISFLLPSPMIRKKRENICLYQSHTIAQTKNERNWAPEQICFVAAMLFWHSIKYCHPHNKCRARKKCSFFLRSFPRFGVEFEGDKHTKTTFSREDFFVINYCRGEIVKHTFLHAFTIFCCVVFFSLRKCENIRDKFDNKKLVRWCLKSDLLQRENESLQHDDIHLHAICHYNFMIQFEIFTNYLKCMFVGFYSLVHGGCCRLYWANKDVRLGTFKVHHFLLKITQLKICECK